MRKLLLIDGHSLIHRAYHAYPKTLATRKGELTNAVYGFTKMLLTAISEIKPTHVAMSFDLPKPTFREQMFVGYKKSRAKPEEEMIAQIPRVKEVVKALNIPIYEVAGFEADDVIGTLASQAVNKASGTVIQGSNPFSQVARPTHVNSQSYDSTSLNDRPINSSNKLNSELTGDQFLRKKDSSPCKVVILTSDRDLMQLIVDDQIVVKLPAHKRTVLKRTVLAGQELFLKDSDIWNEERFEREWGFEPELMPDYKGLAGDASDDIPGVRGIGSVTAKKLISQNGSIEKIYSLLFPALASIPNSPAESQAIQAGQPSAEKLKISEKIVQKLAEGQESAQMSKKLATIDVNVPIKIDWKGMAVHEYDKDKVLKLFEELQFNSLINKLPNDSFEESVQETLF